MSKTTTLLALHALMGVSCTPYKLADSADPREGMNPGECDDGADNDGDGYYDCDDHDCTGAPDCKDGADSGSGGGVDSGPDPDTTDSCASDDDCAAGYACISGECTVDDAFLAGSEEGESTVPGGGTSLELSDGNCFELPLSTYQVTGYSHGDTVSAGYYHAGDDLNGSNDTPVYAIYDGTVRYADTAGSWGTLVEVLHTSPDGIEFYTIYGHLGRSDLLVAAGDHVTAGQTLGYLGTTSENGGWAEHLHYSIYTGTHPSSGVLKGHVTSLDGYEDPLPWMEEHGSHSSCSSECDVSGNIDSAAVSLGQLEVSGEAEAGEGLAKWSLVVDEDVVTSETYSSGPSSDTIDVSVDLSAFEFDDGTHTLALWVRDETGCTGDDPVDTTSINCSAASYYQCDDGDVYYYNACGTRGDRKESCSSGETCVNTSSTKAECSETCGDGSVDAGEDCDGSDLDGATCTSLGYDSGSLSCDSSCNYDESSCCSDESYYQCQREGVGYDIYWYDSCGTRGDIKENCTSSETCVNDSSTTASCDTNCGNGTVDSGEDCDGSDLDGATCASLGYDSGSLSCDSSCNYDTADCDSCTDESYYQCYSGDVYWYDSCGTRGTRKENCDASTEGCQNTSSRAAECYAEAIDSSSLPTTCGTDSQDIFTATEVTISSESSDPEITVTWEKCDGTAFSSTKTCHVRVGSYESYGTVRDTYTITGSSSRYSWETTFSGWPSSSDFASESCGETKDFYFTCNDGSSVAHWYGTGAVVIEKDCP